VLDLLSGRYPSDEFAELRPRLTWDRTTSVLTARQGARHIAVANAGTIPDRGLYGVFLAGAAGQKPGPRVGELDEEMVFESRRGDVFLLGASSWRVEEITFDRVLCSPAPGEPGKMPFWRGEAAGRPLEFGEAIGRLVRELRALPASAAARLLHREYDLDADAATNLLAFLDEQAAATGAVPSDEHLIIERYHDEVGDTRVCVLSPLGGRVHAPWCLAAAANVREQLGYMPESMWTDDGFALRVPHGSPLPEPAQLLPEPDAVEALVVRTLGESQLLMAKFREVAGRALLLPKRRPFGRSPLWHQRKRAAELFRVAAQYPSFPMLLEAYRECLRDVFDLQALVTTLRRVKQGTIAVTVVDTHRPSPLARTLLFSYLASYIYEGDAPQAERRAQALSIDRERLAELVGEVNLRELLDAQSIAEVEAQLQSLEGRQHVRSADGLHDLLLRLGDLGAAELAARTAGGAASATSLATALVDDKRALWLRFGAAGGQPESRLVASEDAARYRDALGLALPDGMPPALLGPVPDALLGLLRRFARTHGPFTVAEAAARFGLLPAQAEPSLRQLRQSGRLVEGELRPASQQRDLCDEEVLQRLRRRALARARREIEPVPPRTLGRLLGHLQGVVGPGVRQRAHRRAGLDALLDAVQSLQGAPLVASQLEREILPARVADYTPAQLDTLLAAGELVWCGVESLGDHDGRVALFLTDQLPVLWRPRVKPSAAALSPRAQQLYTQLHRRGAQFFAPLHEAAGGGFTGATLEALWELVWAGLGTSDTLGALRAYLGVRAARPSASPRASAAAALRQLGFRSRRSAVPPAGQGRWVLTGAVPRDADVAAAADGKAEAAFSAAWAQQLLSRYGVVVRDTALAEGLPGGFAAVYPALKRMEETGRVRRGWFVAGQSATQFAVPAALELLRSLRDDPEHPESVVLCAADPANPYGALLKWPKLGRAEPLLPPAPEGAAGVTGAASESARTLQRSPGAYVVLVDGALTAYARRLRPDLLVFLPAEEPGRTRVARATAERLAELARRLPDAGLIITTVNQVPTAEHELAAWLQQAGFFAGASGYQISRRPSLKVHTATAGADYARYQAVELEPGEDAADAPDAEEPGAG
jgi:ATP-dependent Lhr-like helicase